VKKRDAYWTYDPAVHSYYFAPNDRHEPPYKKQIFVEAIIDVAADGTMAGIEIIDPKMPPPPKKSN
jgi:hypothetical protein